MMMLPPLNKGGKDPYLSFG